MANEKRLIDANALKEKILSLTLTVTGGRWSGKRVLIELLNKYRNGILQLVNEQPTVDAVSRGVHDQVRWERDVAIEQLESYGISLGEKADVVKVIRCKDCKHLVLTAEGEHNPCDCVCDFWMTDGLNDNDFCYYGERRTDNG